MHCVREITKDLYWVGGNDRRITMFENIHPLKDGVSYNSYLLLDKKTVLFDTVDWTIVRQFVENSIFSTNCLTIVQSTVSNKTVFLSNNR